MPVTLAEPNDTAGLDAAVARVHALVADEVARGTPAARIVVGGFSQGATVAAWAVATSPHRLAGCALWSGYGQRCDELAAELRGGANASTPFISGHGTDDRKVLPEAGAAFVDAIAAAGVPLTRRTYAELGHGCSAEQIDDLASFVNGVARPLSGSAGSAAGKKAAPKARPAKKTD